MDEDEVGEVASGSVGADDADEVSLEEAYAALGLDADGNPTSTRRDSSFASEDDDDESDLDADYDEDDDDEPAEGSESEEEEEEQADDDDEDGKPASKPEAAQRRESPKQRFRRERDEAQASVAQLQQREEALMQQGRKLYESYSKVQEDYDDLQADFEDMSAYAKELEEKLRDELGWEPDARDVELRQAKRENRKLARAAERAKKVQEQQTTEANNAEIERAAQGVYQQAMAVAKKHRVDAKKLGAIALTALQSGMEPDLEQIAQNLAVLDPKRVAAAKQRRVNGKAPRTLRGGRRVARSGPSSDDEMIDEATAFMEERFKREGRVLR